MGKQQGRNGDAEANGDSVECEDVSESNGSSGGLLDGLFGGATPSNGGAAAGSNAESARSDDARALVRSILDGLQEPTTVVDTDGRITHVNTQALALYDCTESEAMGR